MPGPAIRNSALGTGDDVRFDKVFLVSTTYADTWQLTNLRFKIATLIVTIRERGCAREDLR